MSVEAVIGKSKKDFNGETVIRTRSYVEAKSSSAATHIMLEDGSYKLITSDLVIYERNGEEVREVKYSDIKSDGHYFIKNKNDEGAEVEVNVVPTLFSQIVIMNPNPEGNFYRCADGRYIHKDEVQIPAYKKVETSDETPFVGPVHDGKFYVGTPDDGENYREISHVLIDGKIVDIGTDDDGNPKVEIDDDGTASITVAGEKKQLTESDIAINESYIAVFRDKIGSDSSKRFYPLNAEKIAKNSGKGTRLELSFDGGDVKSVYISSERSIARIEFRDGRSEIYLQPGREPHHDWDMGPNVRVFRVDHIEAKPAKDGDKNDCIDIKFSGQVEVDKNNLDIIINDFDIQNIEWEFDREQNINVVKSYQIGDKTIRNIKWEDGKIKSFTLIHKNKKTITVSGELVDNYKHLLITTVPAQKVTDITFTDGDKLTVSFKMGAIEIRDAEIVAGKGIGNCTLVYQGKQYKVNLLTDERFKELSAQVTMKVKSDIIPLMPSKLMEKVDGKYKVVADVVQTGPILTDVEWARLSDAERAELEAKGIGPGYCGAHEVNELDDALKQQEEFRQKPFKTVVIDDKNPNQTHELDDFKNTYEGTSEFELDPKIIPNVIGGSKVEVINGRVVVDSKKANDVLFSLAAFGMGITTYLFPVGMLIGLPMVGVAAVGAVVAPIYRAIKAYRINHLNPEKMLRKMQKNAEKVCKRNIRKYDRELRREVRKARKLPDAEYGPRVAELKLAYMNKCEKEIGRLQILSQGQLDIPFDLNKKSKITNANVIGFAMARRRERAFIRGDRNALSTSKRAFRRENGYTRKEAKEHTADYENWKAERKSSAYIAEHGSLRQKIKVFKQSDEYVFEPSRKKRREMVKAKREALLESARKAVPARIDESECDIKSNIVHAHMEETVETVETKRPSRFGFTRKAAAAVQTADTDYSAMISHKVERTSERERAADAVEGKKALETVEERIAGPKAMVETANQNLARATESADFEEAYKAHVMNSNIARRVLGETADISREAHSTKYVELNSDKLESMDGAVSDVEVDVAKSRNQAKILRDQRRAQYEKHVERWAMADLIAAHKTDFDAFIAAEQAKGNTSIPVDVQIMRFKSYLVSVHPEKKDSINAEMDTYRIKNNIETRVQAEVVCEQDPDGYNAWLAEHPKMKRNGEVAKCAYYEYCVREKPDVANQFKLASGKFNRESYRACQEKAEEMFNSEENKLQTSEEKQEKFKNIQSEVEEKRAQEAERKKEEERVKNKGMGLWDRVKAAIAPRTGKTA